MAQRASAAWLLRAPVCSTVLLLLPLIRDVPPDEGASLPYRRQRLGSQPLWVSIDQALS
jgi:hypothetical protein